MPQPTLKASETGIEKAKIALTDKCWSRQDLASCVVLEGKKPQTGINIQTVNSFFSCKDIKSQYFVGICKALGLDWQEIENSNTTTSPEIPLTNHNPSREIAQPDIKYDNPFIPQHGKIDDPRFFFGRQREIRRVFELLNSGSNVAVIGEEFLGKSSLLQAIYREVPNQLRYARKPIYLDLQIVCDENDFHVALCHKAGIDQANGSELSRALESNPLLLFLDEIENMKWDGFTNPTRSRLRGLTEGSNPPLRLVIAARTSLDIIFPGKNMTSPFKGHEETLKRWDDEISREFIVSRLQADWLTPVDKPVSFTENEIAELIAESGGYPQKLMMLCYQTYARYLSD
jgi:hypothetical protein